MKEINKDEFDKLLRQATIAVLSEGYSQEQAQKLCRTISNKFDDFLKEEWAKKNIRNKKYIEQEKLIECNHFCFPFNPPLITSTLKYHYENNI